MKLDKREKLLIEILLEQLIKEKRLKIPFCEKLAPIERDISFLEQLKKKIKEN